MSLINVYGDGLLDVWNEAFGEVWFGTEIVTINIPGLEWKVDASRLHWTLDTGRPHWALDADSLHWKTTNQ